MISLRLTIAALVVAAALAGSFTYFVSPPPRVEAEQRSAAPARDATGNAASIGQDRSAEDFLRTAEAILRPLSSAQASARPDDLPIVGHVPLPRRRPIPR
jgi:hypothetical protein